MRLLQYNSCYTIVRDSNIITNFLECWHDEGKCWAPFGTVYASKEDAEAKLKELESENI